MSSDIKNMFFVVVPTKNRHDTLKSSIKTVLQQDYKNFCLIVSDNFSTPETKEVVESFSDPRIKYVRTDKLMCMVNSWEFALSHVHGEGYVHFMGDDNGLLPGTFEYLNRIINATGSLAILSDMVQYCWPSVDEIAELRVPLSTEVYEINSKMALKRLYDTTIGFSRLPTINASFVSTRLINEARLLSRGRYFCASNPDVYSSIVNAFCVDSYVITRKPFVVNGASSHSNGASVQPSRGKSAFIEHNLLDGYQYHYLFPASTSYYLNVYEACAIAADIFKSNGVVYKINYKKLVKKLIGIEFIRFNRSWLESDIEDFLQRVNIDNKMPKLDEGSSTGNERKGVTFEYESDNSLLVRSQHFIRNVHDASLYADEILSMRNGGKYSARAKIKDYVIQLMLGAKKIGVV